MHQRESCELQSRCRRASLYENLAQDLGIFKRFLLLPGDSDVGFNRGGGVGFKEVGAEEFWTKSRKELRASSDLFSQNISPKVQSLSAKVGNLPSPIQTISAFLAACPHTHSYYTYTSNTTPADISKRRRKWVDKCCFPNVPDGQIFSEQVIARFHLKPKK